MTLSSRFPESLEQVNEGLKERTTLCNTAELTVADAIVFGRVLPVAKEWDTEKVKALRHIVRWADYVQNKLDLPAENRLKVDVNLDAPREFKAKPEKKKKAAVEQPQQKQDEKPAAAEGGERKEKKEKKKKEKKPQPVKEEVPITPGMIDLRVGHIEKAIKHPDADSLYVSTIHLGDEEGPRQICSGLVKYYPLEALQNRMVVVVANLKPVNMRGIKSCGMVLCASNDESVEFVNPPEGAKAGDKVFFESYDIEPERQLNPKKKIWETIQPHFTTDENLNVVYRKEGEPDCKLVTKTGDVCKSSTLTNAQVR